MTSSWSLFTQLSVTSVVSLNFTGLDASLLQHSDNASSHTRGCAPTVRYRQLFILCHSHFNSPMRPCSISPLSTLQTHLTTATSGKTRNSHKIHTSTTMNITASLVWLTHTFSHEHQASLYKATLGGAVSRCSIRNSYSYVVFREYENFEERNRPRHLPFEHVLPQCRCQPLQQHDNTRWS